MTGARIAGLIAIVVSVLAGFITIPYVGLVLLVLGLFIGFTIVREDHVRVIVTALALTYFAHNFDVVPQLGTYLSMMVANFAMATAGAALMIIFRNICARFIPMGKQ